MSPILDLHRYESQAVRGEPNIGEPQTFLRILRSQGLYMDNCCPVLIPKPQAR